MGHPGLFLTTDYNVWFLELARRALAFHLQLHGEDHGVGQDDTGDEDLEVLPVDDVLELLEGLARRRRIRCGVSPEVLPMRRSSTV